MHSITGDTRPYPPCLCRPGCAHVGKLWLLLLCDVAAQVTRPSKLYWGGEKAVFEALGNAKRMRLVDHVGLIGYKADQVSGLSGRGGRLAWWAY